MIDTLDESHMLWNIFILDIHGREAMLGRSACCKIRVKSKKCIIYFEDSHMLCNIADWTLMGECQCCGGMYKEQKERRSIENGKVFY